MNAKVFTLDSDSSNSMKSGNPHSGIHEAFFAKTLDTTLPSPCKAQGGQMIVEEPGKMKTDNGKAGTPPPEKGRAKPMSVVCFNGGGFGQRVASDVSGPITTHEEGIRGDTKLVMQVYDED